MGLARRSIDNSALTRQFSPTGAATAAAADNYLAAAAAALASGTAVGSLGGAPGGGPGGVLAPNLGGSLPTQSFMAAAAAALARGQSSPAAAGGAVEDDRALSLDQ